MRRDLLRPLYDPVMYPAPLLVLAALIICPILMPLLPPHSHQPTGNHF